MTIREKILIVEDEKSIAHFISTILTTNGYETILAKTGTEAMTMLSSHCPDLVILDLGLPDMDGIEVLRSLRGWSSLPVVVVSARTHENDKVEALDLGADDYLTKPFGTAELLARVRTAIRHTRTTSPTGEIAQRGTYSVGEMVIDYNKHQVLVRGENALPEQLSIRRNFGEIAPLNKLTHQVLLSVLVLNVSFCVQKTLVFLACCKLAGVSDELLKAAILFCGCDCFVYAC